MVHRSTAVLLFVFIALLFIVINLFVNPGLPPVSGLPATGWVVLAAAALIFQLLIGFSLWWLFSRRQRSVGTEVLHTIVHEFQTPVTAIRMAVDILQSPITQNQPERTDKYVRIIREETERLQHQVETMLTLARADRNRLQLNPEPIRLHQLLHSVAERHGDYLTLHLPATDPYILADRIHLTNVLYNLLDNAIKYSSGEPAISIQTKMTHDGLNVSVRDRGVGIPPKLVTHIFQPFFRVHDETQPSVKGFGLGLSYVQRIVQSHNWAIQVKSEVGQGSEFFIQIPPSSLLPMPETEIPSRHTA